MRSLILFIFALTTFAAEAQVSRGRVIDGSVIPGHAVDENFATNPYCARNAQGGLVVGGGTFTRSTSVSLSPVDTACRVQMAGGSGVTTISLDSFRNYLKNDNCAIRIKYTLSAGSGAGVDAYASTAESFKVNLAATSDPREAVIAFPCGDLSGATTLKFAEIGTNGIDLHYSILSAGKNMNIGTVQQARWMGAVKYVGIANCLWRTSSTSFVNFTADADCNNPVATGTVGAPGTKIPAVVVTGPPGTYQFVAKGSFNVSGATENSQFRFSDGTNSSSPMNIGDASSFKVPVLIGEIQYNSPITNLTVNLQGRSFSGTGFADIQSTVAGSFELQIDVYYFPTQAQTAVHMSQVNYGPRTVSPIVIGAETTPPTKGVVVRDRVVFSRRSNKLLLEYQYSQGATTGSNAGSGNYLVSIPSESGCVIDTTAHPVTTTSYGANAAYSLNSVVGYTTYANPASSSAMGPVSVYSTTQLRFHWNTSSTASQTGPNTFGSAFSPFTVANSVFNAVVEVTCSNWTENHNSPPIVGGVTSSYADVLKTEVVNFGGVTAYGSDCSASPCTLWNNTPAITSVTRTTTGEYNVIFAAGTFSARPSCNVNTLKATGNTDYITLDRATLTTTNLKIFVKNNSIAAADAALSVICVGPR